MTLAEGGDPAADRKAALGGSTLAELHQRYVEKAQRKNKSWRQAARLIERNVLPRLGRMDARKITRAHVLEVLEKIDDRPILYNQVLASLATLMKWAVKQESIPHNVCKDIDRNPTRDRERVLDDSEIPRFWAEMPNVLKALLLLGQRPGEISHMRWEHIRNGWWTLPGEEVPGIWPGTKNKRTHSIWLPKVVQEMIGTGETGFVFSRRGHLDVLMRSICAKLGIGEKVTPHDLRRTHGSTITGLGFGRDAMNRIQNHKEGGIADVYDRNEYKPENQRVMEAVARRILDLAEGRQAIGDVIHFPDLIKKN